MAVPKAVKIKAIKECKAELINIIDIEIEQLKVLSTDDTTSSTINSMNVIRAQINEVEEYFDNLTILKVIDYWPHILGEMPNLFSY